MIGFRVIARIGQNGIHSDTRQSAEEKPAKAVQIDHRPNRCKGTENQMTRAIADHLQLWKVAVSHHLRDFRGTFATPDEVTAGTRGVQARRICRG